MPKLHDGIEAFITKNNGRKNQIPGMSLVEKIFWAKLGKSCILPPPNPTRKPLTNITNNQPSNSKTNVLKIDNSYTLGRKFMIKG